MKRSIVILIAAVIGIICLAIGGGVGFVVAKQTSGDGSH